jgi:hypothetical protein
MNNLGREVALFTSRGEEWGWASVHGDINPFLSFATHAVTLSMVFELVLVVLDHHVWWQGW